MGCKSDFSIECSPDAGSKAEMNVAQSFRCHTCHVSSRLLQPTFPSEILSRQLILDTAYRAEWNEQPTVAHYTHSLTGENPSCFALSTFHYSSHPLYFRFTTISSLCQSMGKYDMASNEISQRSALPTACPSRGAQTAVFQTQEILEMILDNLSFPDLAACQAISKNFLFSIQNSSLLQRKISRETVRTETLRYLPTSGGAFGFVIGREITERKLCPLLSFDREGYNQGPAPPDCFPYIAAECFIGEYLSAEVSWENVYLTNPPVTEAWIGIRWKVESDEFEGSYSESRRVVSENGEGLTVGKLYKGLMGQRRWTAQCGAVRKEFPRGRGAYMCAREKTVAESLARLEEITGCKAEVANGRCSVSFPKMVGVRKR